MKIICVGRNYVAHAKELNNEIPDEPVLFMKPDTALLRNNDPFYIPDWSNNVHHEIELIVRIKKLGKNIERLKTELKNLIRLQSSSGMDDEVYREEYKRVSGELEEFRDKRAEYDKDSILKENLKVRIDEIIQVLKGRQEALVEFDEGIFNALVEKIDIISSAHFVFELKSGMRIEEIGG